MKEFKEFIFLWFIWPLVFRLIKLYMVIKYLLFPEDPRHNRITNLRIINKKNISPVILNDLPTNSKIEDIINYIRKIEPKGDLLIEYENNDRKYYLGVRDTIYKGSGKKLSMLFNVLDDDFDEYYNYDTSMYYSKNKIIANILNDINTYHVDNEGNIMDGFYSHWLLPLHVKEGVISNGIKEIKIDKYTEYIIHNEIL